MKVEIQVALLGLREKTAGQLGGDGAYLASTFEGVPVAVLLTRGFFVILSDSSSPDYATRNGRQLKTTKVYKGSCHTKVSSPRE